VAGGHIAESGSVDWRTPSKIVEPSRAALGGRIDLDPCSTSGSLVKARHEFLLSRREDGLGLSWTHPHELAKDFPYHDGLGTRVSVYVNPPYGRCYLNRTTFEVLTQREFRERFPDVLQRKHLTRDRAWTVSDIGDWVEKAYREHQAGADVVMLIPAAVDTAHWQDVIFPHAKAICYLRGRVRFEGAAQGAPMACATVYFGADPLGFMRAFHHLGSPWFGRTDYHEALASGAVEPQRPQEAAHG
jgi:hypothetical protein